MEEKEYRQLVDQVFKSLGNAFESIDPDTVECEFSQGSVILSFANGAKCILSTQPSVRQVWLANASKGVAFHFNYDSSKHQWIDDKGKGVELLSYVRGFVREAAGVELKF